MSIIYEALKRIESKKTKDAGNLHSNPQRDNFKFPRMAYIICILIIFILLGVLIIKRSFFGNASVSSSRVYEQPSVSKKQVAARIKPISVKEKEIPSSTSVKDLPPLSLTGIFFTDGEYMALVNDQMVRAGDFIEEEVQIGKIDSDGMEIKFKGSTFRLSYP